MNGLLDTRIDGLDPSGRRASSSQEGEFDAVGGIELFFDMGLTG